MTRTNTARFIRFLLGATLAFCLPDFLDPATRVSHADVADPAPNTAGFALLPGWTQDQVHLVEQNCKIDSARKDVIARQLRSFNLEALFLVDACYFENFVEDNQLKYIGDPKTAASPALRKMLSRAYAPELVGDPDYAETIAFTAIDKARQDGRLHSGLKDNDPNIQRDIYAYWRAALHPANSHSKPCRKLELYSIPGKHRFARQYLYYKLFDFDDDVVVRENSTLARLLMRERLERLSDAKSEQLSNRNLCLIALLSLVEESAEMGDALSRVALISIARRTSHICDSAINQVDTAKDQICSTLRANSNPSSVVAEKAIERIMSAIDATSEGRCSSLSCSQP